MEKPSKSAAGLKALINEAMSDLEITPSQGPSLKTSPHHRRFFMLFASFVDGHIALHALNIRPASTQGYKHSEPCEYARLATPRTSWPGDA